MDLAQHEVLGMWIDAQPSPARDGWKSQTIRGRIVSAWRMSHSYSCNFQHIVFSTKERRRVIPADLQDSVAGYIGGIARQNGMIAMAVGGTQDHVHLFLAIPPMMPVSKAVQLVKAGSSKWFRETHSRLFAWQEGYGAFSVSKSNEKKVVSYIRGQKEHHKKQDFVEEFKELLRKHGLQFEPSDLD